MKQFFSIVLLGFFSLLLSGCGEADENPEQKAQEDLKKTSFEVTTPDDWEIIPASEYPQNVLLIKREPSFSSEISSLLSLSVEKGTYHSLEKFAERNLEAIRKNSQDFRKILTEKITLDSGEDAILVEYSERYSKKKTALGFYTLFVIDSASNKSYSVSLLFDPTTDPDHKDFLKKVIKTFTLPSS